ncbi:MAG: hypothetical protein ACRDZR_18025, partial [Acidimicrobiales bacterium]
APPQDPWAGQGARWATPPAPPYDTYAPVVPPGYPPYGGYAPPGSQPPPGQAQAPGQAVPPGQPVPPGQYPPPGGQPPPGQFPPPGQYPPPGLPPGAGGYPYGAYPQQPYGWPYAAPPPRRVRTPEERRRRRRRGLLAAGALVVLAGAGIGLGLWLAPTPPATVAEGLATQAVAAGNDAGSFHYVQRSTEDGVRDDIAGVAGPDSGQQLITERGATGIDLYHLRLVHGVVYFRGNVPAVVDQLHVPRSGAATVAGEWVSVHKGASPYATFAAGITTRSNLSQLPTTFVPSSSQARGATTAIVGGLNAGKGRAPVGAARLVVATSSTLPHTFEAKASRSAVVSLRLSWSFSQWGASVHVAAPSGAVPYSSLGATSSSKG